MNTVEAKKYLKRISAKSSKDFDLMEAYDFPKSFAYLMAVAKIITFHKVTGIKQILFENLIYKFFEHVKLKVEALIPIKEIAGNVYKAEQMKIIRIKLRGVRIAIRKRGHFTFSK